MKVPLFTRFLFSALTLSAQQPELYPVNWWTGMKWNKVQILVRNESSLAGNTVRINYPGVTVVKVHLLENEKYLAVDVAISATAKPGTVKINFEKGGSKTTAFCGH